MKIVKREDWKTQPFPLQYVTLAFNLHYTPENMQLIKRGFSGGKWFMYYEDNILYLHRSATGYCIYKAYFKNDRGSCLLTHADINRDRKQYPQADDTFDQHNLPYLIDILLEIGLQAEDFVRIIPVQSFLGLPAPAHRPYAFYSDSFSLEGLTVSAAYQLVKGLSLPPKEYLPRECRTPFAGDYFWNQRDIDAPLAKIKVSGENTVLFEKYPQEWFDRNWYVVLKVSRSNAIRQLDVFPATWRALSFIVSDPERMGAQGPSWSLGPVEYAKARVHALFSEVQMKNDGSLLALHSTKESLGLTDLGRLPDPDEESKYYSYLSKDSAFTDKIVELFGISRRCWHGCGYLGWVGEPLCRFFLLRNIMVSDIKVSIMQGEDLIVD